MYMVYVNATFTGGKVTTATDQITFKPTGLPGTTIYAVHASPPSSSTPAPAPTPAVDAARNHLHMGSDGSLVLTLHHGAAGCSTAKGTTAADIRVKLDTAKSAEEQLLRSRFGVGKEVSGQAVKAAAMWTLVSTPEENALAPFNPVSLT